jgi:hypothetical protein
MIVGACHRGRSVELAIRFGVTVTSITIPFGTIAGLTTIACCLPARPTVRALATPIAAPNVTSLR